MIQAVRLAGVALLVAYAAVFIGTNGDRITMVLPLIGRWEAVPGWVVVLLAIAVGLGTASLGWSWLLVRQRKQARRDQKRIGQLERELHSLRTLPLGEQRPEAPAASPAGE